MHRSTRVFFAAVAGGIASAAHAYPVPNIVLSDGNVLDVEGVVGSGQYTSYEVIDFQDTGGGSFAWEYKYNTPVSGFQMLQDIAAADPRLAFEATYYSEFNEYQLDNFSFESEGGNPNDYWRYLNGVYDSVNKTVDWTDASSGAGDVMISDGSFDGWYNSFANDNPPRLPETGITGAALAWNNAGAASPTDGQTWDATHNNWNTGAGATVYTDGDAVTFSDSNHGHYSVTLNTTASPASVTVDNSLGNYTIAGTGKIADAGAFVKTGSGTLTVGAALSVGSISITGGTLKLAANTTLGSGTVTGNINLTSLSITGNGVLDVNNNHIIIAYGASDPIATIAAYIKSGYNGGAWNGPGIDSSAAAINPGYALGFADGADGVVAGLSSGQIEVMYTLVGDANLDGLVNGADFNILAANFNQNITGWDQGDFNYDGLVNAADFNELAANFNQGVSGAASAGDVAALDAFAAANGLSLPTSNVPEPGIASVGLGLVCLLHRRKRRED